MTGVRELRSVAAMRKHGVPRAVTAETQWALLEQKELQQRRDDASAKEGEAAAAAAAAAQHSFGGRAVAPQVVGHLLGTGFWVGLVSALWLLDRALFQSLGYGGLSNVVALFVVLLAGGCGLVLSDLVGATHFLHQVQTMPRWARAALAALFLAAYVALALQLPAVAAQRSAHILGPATDNSRAVLEQQTRAAAPSAVRIERARLDLVRAETNEARMRRIDQFVVVAGTTGDLGLAWTLPRLLSMAVVPWHRRRARRFAAAQREARERLDRLPQELAARLSTAALKAGVDPATVTAQLAGSPGRQAAVVPPAGPPAPAAGPDTPRPDARPAPRPGPRPDEAAPGLRQDPWNPF